MIDMRRDGHVHTAFSAGRDSVSALVAAAETAGVRELTFADHVGPDTSWLPFYLAAIHRAQQRTDLRLRIGVEVEAIGPDGWLAFPSDLAGLDVVSLGLNRLPMPDGLRTAESVRAILATGALRPAEVVHRIVTIIGLALERVSRYAPTMLARPLEFLARAGIAESDVDDDAIGAVVAACQSAGTVVELSERHRMPSGRLARALAEGGVRMVPASDAYTARDVGRWQYVAELMAEPVAPALR